MYNRLKRKKKIIKNSKNFIFWLSGKNLWKRNGSVMFQCKPLWFDEKNSKSSKIPKNSKKFDLTRKLPMILFRWLNADTSQKDSQWLLWFHTPKVQHPYHCKHQMRWRIWWVIGKRHPAYSTRKSKVCKPYFFYLEYTNEVWIPGRDPEPFGPKPRWRRVAKMSIASCTASGTYDQTWSLLRIQHTIETRMWQHQNFIRYFLIWAAHNVSEYLRIGLM